MEHTIPFQDSFSINSYFLFYPGDKIFHVVPFKFNLSEYDCLKD